MARPAYCQLTLACSAPMVELVIWHEAQRISHADAVAKAKTRNAISPHPAVAEFYAELAKQLPDLERRWDKKSHVRVTIPAGSAVKTAARVRYLAAKHRLVCLDVGQQAVVNPPLLRRPDSYELTGDSRLAIEDPTAEHIMRAAHGLSDANWFMALEGDDDHFLQCGIGARSGARPGNYMLETRDAKHLQVEVSEVAEVIAAFQAHLIGDDSWRDSFTWRPVAD